MDHTPGLLQTERGLEMRSAFARGGLIKQGYCSLSVGVVTW